MSIPGADISGWQPANVDLSGLEFLYVKSTQGLYKVNANHDAQVAQARAAGLVVGHYHFPAWGDPVQEAQAFVNANGALPGEFLVLDIEDSPQTPWPGDPVTWCCAFVDEVHRLTGLWCMDYCGPNVRHTWDWTALAQRGGGLISPEYNNIGPSDPSPWAATAMWQNANTNISGGDSDVFFGDRTALLAYGTPTGVTLDGTTITPIPEDDMFTDADRGALTQLFQALPRITQILEAVDVRTGDPTKGNLASAADLIKSRINTAVRPDGTPYKIACQGDVDTLLGKVANVPAGTLNQGFTLADGTSTNLAGILAQINAKPAVTAAPAAVDVDALAAKLTAILPPAVVSVLAAKLSQP